MSLGLYGEIQTIPTRQPLLGVNVMTAQMYDSAECLSVKEFKFGWTRNCG